MKVGDIVKRIDNWVKYNPWMTEPASENHEEYGIVLYLPKQISYKPSIKVLWATLGIMMEHPDDICILD